MWTWMPVPELSEHNYYSLEEPDSSEESESTSKSDYNIETEIIPDILEWTKRFFNWILSQH